MDIGNRQAMNVLKDFSQSWNVTNVKSCVDLGSSAKIQETSVTEDDKGDTATKKYSEAT